MKFNFSLVVPVYNEEDNIDTLFNEINVNLSEDFIYELIFVNDCSTDNTLKKLLELNKKYQFVIINNDINYGQSKSLFKGIMEAKSNIIVTIDGDLQNNPSDISKMVKLYNSLNHIKLVSGIRFQRKDNFIKIISSKIANLIRSSILKDGCIDTGCSLKVFDRNIFLSFPFFNGIHRFIPALFHGYEYKVFYVNVDHRKRLFGVSKYGTFGRLFKGIMDIIKVKRIINKHQKSKNV